jgi:tRNA(Met) cytidine acetyltransferase
MATAGVRAAVGSGCDRAGPPDLPRVLGREYDYVLLAVEGMLRPNIVAAVAEVVRGGGALVLVAPPLNEWSPGPPGGTGLYREYLVSSIRKARCLLWLDLDAEAVLARRLPEEAAPRRGRPEKLSPKAGVPAGLYSLAATESQARALEAFARFVRGRPRTLLLLGDRGRGKSFLVGLGLALAIQWRAAGRAVVVAPSPESASSLMRGLEEGLRALGLLAVARLRRSASGLLVRVTGPWFRVSLETPETAEPAPLLVVDEAAAVGVARVRRLSWRSGKVVVASTVHGYEGSGRALIRIVKDQLPRPLVEVELAEPIRYPPGDPLEEWIYTTFALKADPEAWRPQQAADLSCVGVPRSELVDSEKMLRVASILTLAHYRSEPDDIMVLLEAENHQVYALGWPDPVAVADVAWEDPSLPEEARLGLKLLGMHAHGAVQGLRSARVVRIAVHPELQRRGLGSRLLECVEQEARRRRADLVVAIFSRHEAAGFWVKNGYSAVYLSPRFNKVTGEKNMAFAKPLTEAGDRAVKRASAAFRLRLLLSLQSIYRDVAAEKVVALLRATTPSRAQVFNITEEQRLRLRNFLEGRIGYEQASDAVYAYIVNCLAERNLDELGLGEREAVALVARVLQGKPLDEVSDIVGVDAKEADRMVAEAARSVVAGCG